MLLICAVFVLIHLLLFEFFIIFAPCRALWAVQEAYLELPAPAEEMDELKIRWNLLGSLIPHPYRYWAEKTVRPFVIIPCESSRAGSCLSQSLAATTSHSLTVSSFHMRWSGDDGAVESLLWESSCWGLYGLGARWGWQSSAIVLHWLGGDSVSCAKRESDKNYSVYLFCFPFSFLSFVVAQVFMDTHVLFREPCFFPGEIRVGTDSKDSPLGRIQLSPLILHWYVASSVL